MKQEHELLKLPDGWKWMKPHWADFDEDPWVADSVDICCYATNNGLNVDSFGGSTCPLYIISAVLFANEVALPDVPGSSSILGGK